MSTVESNLLREAHKWLMCESALRQNRMAIHVMAARISGEECMELAVAWLRRVAKSQTRQALWAAVLLRDMRIRGLIEVARRDVLEQVADLKEELGA